MSTMGGGSRRGWASGDDYFVLSLIVIVAGLGFLGWLLWSEHHAEVVAAVAWLQIPLPVGGLLPRRDPCVSDQLAHVLLRCLRTNDQYPDSSR